MPPPPPPPPRRWGLLGLLAVLVICCRTALGGSGAATVGLSNEAAVDVDVHWRDDGGMYTHLMTIAQGVRGVLNTFQGHAFLVAEHGRAVGPNDVPNFTQQEEAMELRIRGTSHQDLTLLDEGTGQVAANRTRSSNDQVGAHAEVVVQNNAAERVFVYWWNAADHAFVLVATLEDGTEQRIQTFVGHALHLSAFAQDDLEDNQAPNFAVRWVHHRLRLTPGAEDVVVQEDDDVDRTQKKKAAPKEKRAPRHLLQPEQPAPVLNEVSKEQVKASIRTCGGEPGCIATALYRGKVAQVQRSIQAAMTQRDDLEEPYRDYACLNHVIMRPEDIPTTYWHYREGPEGAEEEKAMRVDHYLDTERGDARIYLLHDMVSPTECQALKERVAGRLAAAVVTGDNPGEKVVSAARKAKNAMVRPHLDDPTDVLAPLQRRVFNFVNEHGGGGYEAFTLPGQEPFNVIQYNVSGDEYTAHCDGYCDGSKFMAGGRAATVVLYCEEAARGGQTSFTAADILLKGKAGQAAFFHYRDAEGYMDSGYTKHSGCPLVEGTKWIATQWIRDGVSDVDPWYWFTPTGDKDGTNRGYSRDPHY